MSNNSTDTEPDTEKEHTFGALNTILLTSVLASCLVAGFYIKKHSFHYLPPSAAAILIGTIFGFIIMLVSPTELHFIKFDPNLFFFILLPPIIFEAGYQLQRKSFFRNFTTILLYAVIGTFLSTLVIGGLTYFAASSGMILVDNTSPLESLMFGALISAVDPVATLSIMGNPEIHCDPLLYSLVFGESVLNDAVSIVLFRTFQSYAASNSATEFNMNTLANIFFRFSFVSLGSILIGIVTALSCCVLCKYTQLRTFPGYELAVLMLFPYSSFSVSEALGLSGIMSLFFSGIILSHYNVHNLSAEAKIASEHAYESLALLCETITFAYMGIILFTGEFSQWDFTFIILAPIFCLIARAVNIFPLSALANLGRDQKITSKMQFVMWFAGLRGAIAFALAFNMPENGPMWNREVIVTTTLTVVILSTLIMGGLTEPLLGRMGLKQLPGRQERLNTDDLYDDDHESSSAFLEGRSEDSLSSPMKQSVYKGMHGIWSRLDRNLAPMFGMSEEEARRRRNQLTTELPVRRSASSPGSEDVYAPPASDNIPILVTSDSSPSPPSGSHARRLSTSINRASV